MLQALQTFWQNKASDNQIKIGNFLAEPQHNRLIKEESIIELEPLAMDMLMLLAEEPGRVVSVEELFERLWQGKVVSDNALHRIVGLLRKALGDDANDPKYIRTVRKKGYALICPVNIKINQPFKGYELAGLGLLLLVLITAGVNLLQSSEHQVEKSSDKPTLNQTQLLTSMPGVESQPVYWPQKNAVIFTHQPPGELYNNILLRPLDKSEYQNLTADYLHYSSLSLSQDGQYLAFTRRGVHDCWIMFADLTSMKFNPQTLTTCRFEAQSLITWSPEGNQLIFEDSSEQYGVSRLMTIDLNTRKKQLLLPANVGQNHYFPAMEPDGTRLAFVQVEDQTLAVKLYDIQSKQNQTVIQWPNELSMTSLNWHRQTNSLLIGSQNGLKQLTLDGELKDIDSTTSSTLNTISMVGEEKLVYATTKYYSRLANYRLPQGQQKAISEHDKGTELAPSSKSEYNGQFHPDNQSLVFLSNRESDVYRLWLEQDGKVELLHDGPATGSPLWSPEGDQILFLTPSRQIALFDLASGKVELPIPDANKTSKAIWGKSNHQVIFSQRDGQQHQLFSLDLHTQAIEQLTEDGGFHAQLSQDGESLYYNKFGQTGLWRLNLTNRQHQRVLTDFHQMNYSHWQAFDNGVYYVRDANAKRGLFFHDFATGQQRKLIDNKEFFVFQISHDQKSVLITEKKSLTGDLHLGTLKLD